jgi:hypothetical protein
LPDLSFARFTGLSRPDEEAAFGSSMREAGYFAFFTFLEQFREYLKAYGDAERMTVQSRLRRARAIFPDPGRFSPSWERIWDEFDRLCAAKNEALAAIPAGEREGEWQVLIDNPHLPQQVVCYPGLAFADAVYMYAYFQIGLKPNEILRLQRVLGVLSVSGSKTATLLPTD